MNLHRLTAKGALALGPGQHGDGGGLWLFKTAPDKGSWVFRYSGKNMGLGSMGTVSLAEAREKAHACRALLAAGIDPKEKRDSDRSGAKLVAAKTITFDECAARYIEAHRPSWRNAQHAAQWVATLATYATPIIGALPVSAVDVALVLRILEPIWSTKSETASRLRGRIESVLDWARAREYRTGENPARWRGHLKMLLPAPRKVHRVVHLTALPYAELPGFMAALRKSTGTAERALEFLILTAARSGEVRNLRTAEINVAEKVWTVPAERMKGGREHRVPLSPRAFEIVREMTRLSSAILIFPGTRPGKPLAGVSLTTAMRRLGVGVTVHGFRSTFRTWASERTSFPSEVVEAALAHVNGDKTEAAYQRSDLIEKRRRLMDAWASFAATAPTTATVTPIRQVS